MTTELLSRAANGASSVPSRSIPRGATVKHHPVFGQVPAGELETRVILITPEMAAKLLTMQVRQRVVRKAQVKKWEKRIKAGKFRTTSQGISLTPDGRLLNGQHRLHGVSNTGIPVRMVVAFNEPEENFSDIDRDGVNKDTSDSVTQLGYDTKYRRVFGSAGVALSVLEPSDLSSFGRRVSNTGLGPADLAAVIEIHPLLPETADLAGRLFQKLRGPTGLMAALLVLCREIDDRKALEFADRLSAGTNTGGDDPVFRLRDFILTTPLSHFELSKPVVIGWANSWNAFARGRSLSLLRVTPQGGKLPTLKKPK